MKYRLVLRGIFAIAFGLLAAAAAQAQAFRTYLSGNGSANPSCSLAAPCRLLPDALAAVADGGEVWILNSANYNLGPVTVDKSVTILAIPGALGSVVALGGSAINIATPGVKVTLRNLVIVPYVGGGGTSGIVMTDGASLTVDECLIANLAGFGIHASAAGGSILVMDTLIKGNGMNGLYVGNGAHASVSRTTVSGNAGEGVWAEGNGGSATTVDIADSTIEANFYGVMAASTSPSSPVRVSVRDSQIVRNQHYGLVAQSAGGAPSLSASKNIVSNNDIGIAAISAGAKVWASRNSVSGNVLGLYNAAGSLFESATDNAVRNNDVNADGVISPVGAM